MVRFMQESRRAHTGGSAGLLHLGTANAPGIALNQIANAFSGDASAVAAGGLYSLSGTGFSPPAIDLGLTPDQSLPLQLGGIQVKFDGAPAAILETSPGRVTVVPPSDRPAGRENEIIRGFTAVQLFSGEGASNIGWMPISKLLPGLLTVDFPNLLPHSDFADGNVRNQDGTHNDQNHPAATGSTITLFVTGLGATNSQTGIPLTPVYSTWQLPSPLQNPPPEIVTRANGFISAVFQVAMQVPDSIQNLGGVSVGNGVRRVVVGLQFKLPFSGEIPPASNLVGVYVK
jgi:uncharacterized protein (TIGR03437 family)